MADLIHLNPPMSFIALHFPATGDGTLVMEYEVSAANVHRQVPSILLSGLPWTSEFVDICKVGEVKEVDTNKDTLFLKNNPNITFGEGASGDVGLRGIAFFYLKPISRTRPGLFQFIVDTPQIGKFTTKTVTTYYLWDSTFGASSLDENLLHPFVVGDPLAGPTAVMIVPRPFATSEELGRYLSLGVSEWHGASQSATATVLDGGDWFFDLHDYTPKNRTDFPVNNQNVPTWDTDTADHRVLTEKTSVVNDVPTPIDASRFKVTVIYKTMEIVVEKVT
jgi:hypothetical protein